MNLEVGIVLVIDANMNNSLRPSNLYQKQGLYFIHNLKQSRSLKDQINLFAKNCNQCSVNLKGQYQSKGFNPFNEYSTFRKKKRSDIVSTINNVQVASGIPDQLSACFNFYIHYNRLVPWRLFSPTTSICSNQPTILSTV